jgi:hypothetical protein
MVLVAIGLVLILIQIIRKKSNSWLLAANAISLALVLYACCFLNAPWLIATYNIEHSREISGTGPKLDLWYLVSLGPQAEPALRSHLAEMPGLEPYIQEIRCHRDNSFEYCNYDRQRPENWRAWSFRTWRLERFLANNPLAMPWDHSRDDKG